MDTLAESVRRQRLLDTALSAGGVGIWFDPNRRDVLTNRALGSDTALARLKRRWMKFIDLLQLAAAS